MVNGPWCRFEFIRTMFAGQWGCCPIKVESTVSIVSACR